MHAAVMTRPEPPDICPPPVPQPPEGYSLLVRLGHQGIRYSAGDVVADQSLAFIIRPLKGLFDYPYDTYELDLPVHAFRIKDADESQEGLPLALAFEMSRPGWTFSTEMLTRDAADGSDGVVVRVRVQRSATIRFFSIFLVVMSLCLHSAWA